MFREMMGVILAFALLGFVTWLWGQMTKYLSNSYLQPLINTELAKGEVLG